MHDNLQLSSVAREALTKANAPTNVISGLKKAGIVPSNKHVFEEHEIAPAFATDLRHQKVMAKNDKNMTFYVEAVAPYTSNLNDQSPIILDSVGTFAHGQAVESFSSVSKCKCEPV